MEHYVIMLEMNANVFFLAGVDKNKFPVWWELQRILSPSLVAWEEKDLDKAVVVRNDLASNSDYLKGTLTILSLTELQQKFKIH